MKKEKYWIYVFVLLIFVFLLNKSVAQAKTAPFLENGTLIIREVREKEIGRIPDVPKGITAETAYKLVKGELKRYIVPDLKGKENYFFSYPIRVKIVFSDRAVAFEGKWTDKPFPRTEEKADWPLSVFGLIIPAIGILIVSLVNQLTKTGARKLFVFYVAILAGGLAGGFAGGLAGVLAGGFAGGLAGVLAGVFAGMFAGGFAGVLAGVLYYYLLFILTVEVAAFLTALIVVQVKKSFPAIKKWVENN